MLRKTAIAALPEYPAWPPCGSIGHALFAARLVASARAHVEPEEHRLGVRPAIDEARGAQPQGRIDGPVARAGLVDRIEEGGAVGDMDALEQARDRSIAPAARPNSASQLRLTEVAAARTIVGGDDVAHGLGEDAEAFGIEQRLRRRRFRGG